MTTATGTTKEPTTAQKNLTLQPKTTAAMIAAWLSTIVFYALKEIWSIEPPIEVAVAVTGLLGWIAAFFAPRSVGP